MAHLFGFGHGKGEGGLEFDEILLALLSILPWFRGGQSHAATDSGDKDEKKIISILQAFVSKVDEGIWLSLIARLNKKQKWAITRLLHLLDRFREKDSFRLTVINAPVATTTIDVPDPGDKEGKKKIKKVIKVGEYSNKDTRVVFLKEIAQLVDDPDWGPMMVRNMLRDHELATENKVAENALKFWNGTLAWMNQRVCAFFRVDNISEITPEVLAKVLNFRAKQAARYVNLAARQIPYRPVADMTIGFWRHTFRHHPVQAWALVIGIILTVAFFAIVSPN